MIYCGAGERSVKMHCCAPSPSGVLGNFRYVGPSFLCMERDRLTCPKMIMKEFATVMTLGVRIGVRNIDHHYRLLPLVLRSLRLTLKLIAFCGTPLSSHKCHRIAPLRSILQTLRPSAATCRNFPISTS